ncbi:MAG: aminotransferase class I/II-fold pyridoxal phosphate-dependent enzyme [Thermoflexales bacterium]|nr:aminotransferase class I/II-fold pyridoxal phosphate-dependent enzyme [Thermoflexales bacterium]MDW8350626.1 aminotransferase class I/II-fold pyridoxal phosphate-dependent enzyme [Anaerolineae bacterium]
MTTRHPLPGIQTRVIQGARPFNDTAAVMPPIYQTATYQLPSPEIGAAIAAEVAPTQFYTRYGSPNNKQVEALLATLEGSEAALVLGSGMAAVSTALLSNLKAGDHVVAQRTHYTATLSLLSDVLPRFGIEVTQVDQRDTEAFARAMRPNTKIVYTETPTNPTMDLTDLRATAEIAHARGALAITDNTFASAYNQRPLELGYDLVVHSATKYLNGHSDVTAGVICGSRALIEKAWEHLRVNGPLLHPFEAWLLRRGLLTYGLRMARHNANALAVARFLESHPAVSKVYYPGLESHPQHALAKRQMPGGFGGMVAFELKGGYEAAYRAIGRTKLCILAVSLGGVETLITHPASMVHSQQTDEQRAQAGIVPGLIRLSVGCEDADDIIADLAQALA